MLFLFGFLLQAEAQFIIAVPMFDEMPRCIFHTISVSWFQPDSPIQVGNVLEIKDKL